MFEIAEELKKLPKRPGVYLMHDEDDHIIYVGKAINLYNRVRQYFQAGYDRSPKIERMVEKIAWFETIVTDSETEALVLENNLIKEHRPRYNTMLTDDKGYPYIRVSIEEEFPRVMYEHRRKRDGSRYYGPYTSAGAVKDTLKLVQKLYRIRSCSRRLPEDIGKERPCLNYQIGLCRAPCQGYVTAAEYQESIRQVMDFLGGNYEPVERMLEEKMYAASETMDFENAAGYRELLFSVRHMEESQKMEERGGENRDVLALASDGKDAVAQVFFVREGKLIGRDHFHIRVAEGDTRSQILTAFVKQFYSGTPFLPKEIFLPEPLEEEALLAEWLSTKSGRKVVFVTPKRGEKYQLMELAAKNAELILSQDREKMKRQEARTVGAVRQLGELIDLPGIFRIEAYDISHISGFESVGAMVVYEQGKPKKNDYRKFRIRGSQGANDYASLEEVLIRRFQHGINEAKLLREKGVDDACGSFTSFPDLILMDGGKGQVNVAERVLDSLHLPIPVCGMVKDDSHRTRGLYYQGEEVPLDTHSEVFQLLTRIQDEVHRFAITYHRSRRGKAQVHSILDDIDGIGPARRKALMQAYPSLDAIREADVDQLAALPGMNRPTARTVYAFFHDGELPD